VESSTPSRLDPLGMLKKMPTGVRKCRPIGCSG
jgi:hypothetical protein